jgi:predicted RNA binding protein YcfA (HicA-like mRNA interferase family)
MGKVVRYRTLERALRKRGCTWRRGKGDHVVWYCPCGEHVAVAVDDRFVSPGVIRDIMTKLACLPEGWLW